MSPVPGSKDRGLWTLDHAQADALESMRRLFDQSKWDLVQTEIGEFTQVWQKIESAAKSLESAAGKTGTSNSDSLRELAHDLRVYAFWLYGRLQTPNDHQVHILAKESFVGFLNSNRGLFQDIPVATQMLAQVETTLIPPPTPLGR